MIYKAKVFKSYLRKMVNGKNVYFNVIYNPTSFAMKRLKNTNKF